MSNTRCFAVAVAVVSATMTLPAVAATVETFDWSFTSPNFGGYNESPVAGSGTLTATKLTDDSWMVDSATGKFSDLYLSFITDTVTGIEAPTTNAFSVTNDNEIYPSDALVLDGSGLSFATTGGPISIFSQNGAYEESSNLGAGVGDLVLTAVPEASTWLMMLLGFAGLGLAGRRASRTGAKSAGI